MNNKGNSEAWSFTLPKVIDPDGDPVTITADLGFAANFVVFNSPESIEISDISEGGSNIRDGMFLINFNLFDGKDTATVSFALFVLAPSPLPGVIEPTPVQTVEPSQETSGENQQTAISDEEKAAAELAAQVEFLREELGYEFGDLLTPVQSGNATEALQKKQLLTSVFDWQAAFKRLKQQNAEKLAADTSYVPMPPNPFIRNIDSNGKIEIGFNSDIFVVPNLQMINNGTIYLDDL